MDAAALLSEARRRADLTQHELARRAGMDPSVVSSYERGKRVPSLRALARVLAAAGWQVHAELEPLHADVDREVQALAGLPPAERLARAAPWGQDVPAALASLVAADVPFAVTGPAAALLLGVPVPLTVVDLEVGVGLDAATRLVAGFRGCRGSLDRPIGRDLWNGTGAMFVLPVVVEHHMTAEGWTRWSRDPGDVYAARAVEGDPREAALRVDVAGSLVPVLPPGASTGDPALDRALARWRARQACGGDPARGA